MLARMPSSGRATWTSVGAVVIAIVLGFGGCSKVESTPATAPSTSDGRAQRPRRDSPAGGEPEAGERGKLVGITAAHNAERSKAGVAPLRWSRDLARHAQAWADRLAADGCALEHHGDDPYGENLFWSSASASASAVVAEWAAESRHYNHRTNACRGICGHYTQVVWSATRSLGCGVARCGTAEVWVCNYDPPGNVVGRAPY
jgi:uncharacterized protein YkwD